MKSILYLLLEEFKERKSEKFERFFLEFANWTLCKDFESLIVKSIQEQSIKEWGILVNDKMN